MKRSTQNSPVSRESNIHIRSTWILLNCSLSWLLLYSRSCFNSFMASLSNSLVWDGDRANDFRGNIPAEIVHIKIFQMLNIFLPFSNQISSVTTRVLICSKRMFSGLPLFKLFYISLTISLVFKTYAPKQLKSLC